MPEKTKNFTALPKDHVSRTNEKYVINVSGLVEITPPSLELSNCILYFTKTNSLNSVNKGILSTTSLINV